MGLFGNPGGGMLVIPPYRTIAPTLVRPIYCTSPVVEPAPKSGDGGTVIGPVQTKGPINADRIS